MKNKKTIVIVAAMALTMQATFAASNISGVTGTDGVFNIDPVTSKGNSGFRGYENFTLDANDVANLIFRDKNGNTLSNFINLVDNTVNINGILNSVNGSGAFHNGHVMFITPGGMTIGSSGVLNVGSLSVLTPTADTYKAAKRDMTNMNLKAMQDETSADIKVQGTIMARGNVNLQGSTVLIDSAAKVASFSGMPNSLANKTTADNFFNALVNNMIPGINAQFATKDGKILITSKAKNGGIAVNGDVYNFNNGSVKLTNTNENGGMTVNNTTRPNNVAAGITTTGNIYAQSGQINIDSKGGNTSLAGTITNKNGDILVANHAGSLTSSATLTAESTENITDTAKLQNGEVKLVNEGAGGMDIGGTITSRNKATLYNENGNFDYSAQLTNIDNGAILYNNAGENSKMTTTVASSVSSTKGTVGIENKGADGLEANGSASGTKVTVQNRAGAMNVNGEVNSTTGIVSIYNSGTTMTLGTNAALESTSSNVIVNNKGTGNLTSNADITGNAVTVVNNKGALGLGGTVTNKNGNLIVANKGTGTTISGTLTNNKGVTSIVNYNGDLKISGTVHNKNGNIGITNKNGDTAGKLEIALGGKVQNDTAKVSSENSEAEFTTQIQNSSSGGMKIAGDVVANDVFVINSNGAMNIADTGAITAKTGKLAVKNAGTDMTIDGTINSNGTVGSVLNAGTGAMTVNGDITSKNGNLGVVNRGTSLTTSTDSLISNTNGKTNVINSKNSTGGMTLNGNITTENEVNIINDNGKLTVNGSVQGNASDINIYGRMQSSGIEIAKDAIVNNVPETAAAGGNITIKNTSTAPKEVTSNIEILGTVKGNNDVNIAASRGDIDLSAAEEISGKENVTVTLVEHEKDYGSSTLITGGDNVTGGNNGTSVYYLNKNGADKK